MTRAMVAFAAFVIPAASVAGPISKWDDRKPDFDYVSRANLYDVERCVVDVDGWPPPIVYRQPDRPDRITIIYTEHGGTAGRLDLVVKDGLLQVRGWAAPKAIRTCAPAA